MKGRLPGIISFLLFIAVIAAFAPMALSRFGADARDEHGMSALMHAAWRGDSAGVARLLRDGANVNAAVPTRRLREMLAFLAWMQQLPRSDIGWRALHYAADSGRASVARQLIAAGADVHHPAQGGTTAFEIAVTRSDIATLAVLTAAGVRPDSLHLAAAVTGSSPATVRFLIQNGARPWQSAVPAPGRAGYTAAPTLVLAAKRGDTSIVRMLLDAGAKPSVSDANGWSALRGAGDLAKRRAEGARVVEILQAGGARDVAGVRNAELLSAVEASDAAAVRALLSAGAGANSRDDRGVPMLVLAASHGAADVVAALIEGGAQVNANPANDATPTTVPSFSCYSSAVRTHGCHPSPAPRSTVLRRFATAPWCGDSSSAGPITTRAT